MHPETFYWNFLRAQEYLLNGSAAGFRFQWTLVLVKKMQLSSEKFYSSLFLGVFDSQCLLAGGARHAGIWGASGMTG